MPAQTSAAGRPGGAPHAGFALETCLGRVGPGLPDQDDARRDRLTRIGWGSQRAVRLCPARKGQLRGVQDRTPALRSLGRNGRRAGTRTSSCAAIAGWRDPSGQTVASRSPQWVASLIESARARRCFSETAPSPPGAPLIGTVISTILAAARQCELLQKATLWGDRRMSITEDVTRGTLWRLVVIAGCAAVVAAGVVAAGGDGASMRMTAEATDEDSQAAASTPVTNRLQEDVSTASVVATAPKTEPATTPPMSSSVEQTVSVARPTVEAATSAVDVTAEAGDPAPGTAAAVAADADGLVALFEERCSAPGAVRTVALSPLIGGPVGSIVRGTGGSVLLDPPLPVGSYRVGYVSYDGPPVNQDRVAQDQPNEVWEIVFLRDRSREGVVGTVGPTADLVDGVGEVFETQWPAGAVTRIETSVEVTELAIRHAAPEDRSSVNSVQPVCINIFEDEPSLEDVLQVLGITDVVEVPYDGSDPGRITAGGSPGLFVLAEYTPRHAEISVLVSRDSGDEQVIPASTGNYGINRNVEDFEFSGAEDFSLAIDVPLPSGEAVRLYTDPARNPGGRQQVRAFRWPDGLEPWLFAFEADPTEQSDRDFQDVIIRLDYLSSTSP